MRSRKLLAGRSKTKRQIAGRSPWSRPHADGRIRRTADLVPVILDERLAFSTPGSSSASLLTLPFGTGSILGHLLGQLAELATGRIVIVSPEGSPATYESCLDSAGPVVLRRISPQELEDVFSGCETSDDLLIVQPRCWPLAGYDFAAFRRHCRGHQGVLHAVAAGEHRQEIREHVECDASGYVRRVQRLYESTNWPGIASQSILCSLIPGWAARELHCGCLGELRSELAARGVFTQDIPVASEVRDLRKQADLLDLSNRMIDQALSGPSGNGYGLQGPGILVDSGCKIHPSARLVAPVIVQHDAAIEEGVRVIGPTVIGPGTRVRKGSIVARSLLGPGAVVPAKATVCQQVVLDHCLESGTGAVGTRRKSPATPMPERAETLDDRRQELENPEPERRRRFHFAAKRLLDLVAAVVGLLVLSPLFAVVAVLIKMTSSGPVFFAHYREGKDGREFPCLKFRTMVADAHRQQRNLYQQNQLDGPQFKLENDPRLTRIGRFLRQTNLDELPQLINVLLGQMSLVGPRPSPFRENQICVPWRRARLSVRPGITGLWQLCRDRRQAGDFHQWIYYDLAYVRHFSIWLDLKILFYTLLTKGGRRSVPLSRLIRLGDDQAEHVIAAVSEADR